MNVLNPQQQFNRVLHFNYLVGHYLLYIVGFAIILALFLDLIRVIKKSHHLRCHLMMPIVLLISFAIMGCFCSANMNCPSTNKLNSHFNIMMGFNIIGRKTSAYYYHQDLKYAHHYNSVPKEIRYQHQLRLISHLSFKQLQTQDVKRIHLEKHISLNKQYCNHHRYYTPKRINPFSKNFLINFFLIFIISAFVLLIVLVILFCILIIISVI